MNTVKISKNDWRVKFLKLKPHENLLFGKLQYLKHSWLDFDTGPCPYNTCGLNKLVIKHLLSAIFIILLWIVLFSGSIVTLAASLIIAPCAIIFNILPLNHGLVTWGLTVVFATIVTTFIIIVGYLADKGFPKIKRLIKKRFVVSKLFVSLKEKFCSKIEYID